ncbi:hypothetical protein GWI33_022328 [Rhynchophorus ferrugineus]|uniref:Smr domain-containing protein n=1 Tax=Rhynchophorus ferrugineus TaxID=354439 RepID=A0A834IQY0_RHYFE|nr:hypothetical protein GWI33_022328 [Rhynchophorus ferrugineus]
MQTLMKEDEEFARKLQEDEERAFQQEEEKMPQTSQMDIPEIMREERRKNKWCKDIEKWKELNPDTLAAKMTRDKLFKTFRSVDKDVLVELLYAHNNCYKETVEILLNNTEAHSIDGDIQSIKDPPLSEDVYYQMKEDYDNCQDIVDSSEDTSARDYRQEANKYLKKRADLYQKAQRCYQKGMRDVAQFYSGLASQQTRLYEQANSKAEALPALDVFLDTNINLLRHSVKKTKEYLQIITGRGKHSFKGISVLRPAVENHIIQRGLSFTTLNQGMLEVKLTKNSKLTNEL